MISSTLSILEIPILSTSKLLAILKLTSICYFLGRTLTSIVMTIVHVSTISARTLKGTTLITPTSEAISLSWIPALVLLAVHGFLHYFHKGSIISCVWDHLPQMFSIHTKLANITLAHQELLHRRVPNPSG